MTARGVCTSMVCALQSLPQEIRMKALFNKTIALLSAALSVRAERQGVIAANIANIDTPGFRPGDISFQDALRAQT